MKRKTITNVICIATALSTALAFAPVAMADDAASTDTATQSAGLTAADITYKIANGYTFTSGGCTYKVLSAKASNNIDLTSSPSQDMSVSRAYTGTVSLVKYNGSAKKAKVPDSVSCSATSTFTSADANASIKSVSLTENATFTVASIGAGAFNNAKGHKITKLTVGKNVSSIGDKAFFKCKKLKKIILKGDALRTVGTNSDKKLNRNGKKYVMKLYKLRKKSWKTCKAFKGTPRTCTIKLPNINATKGLAYNMQYANAIRLLAGNAGFVGMVL